MLTHILFQEGCRDQVTTVCVWLTYSYNNIFPPIFDASLRVETPTSMQSAHEYNVYQGVSRTNCFCESIVQCERKEKRRVY